MITIKTIDSNNVELKIEKGTPHTPKNLYYR